MAASGITQGLQALHAAPLPRRFNARRALHRGPTVSEGNPFELVQLGVKRALRALMWPRQVGPSPFPRTRWSGFAPSLRVPPVTGGRHEDPPPVHGAFGVPSGRPWTRGRTPRRSEIAEGAGGWVLRAIRSGESSRARPPSRLADRKQLPATDSHARGPPVARRPASTLPRGQPYGCPSSSTRTRP